MSRNSRSQTRISFLADTPAEKDILDYRAYRDALVSIIEGLDSRTPLTVSIFGHWGSGKTTLLRMVTDELRQRNVQTIWVNVWQFGNEEDVWSAFLQSILLKVKREMPWLKRLLFSFGLLRRQIKWDEVGKRVPEFLFRVLIVIVPLFISLTFLAANPSASSKVTVGAGTILSAVLGWLLVLQPYVNAVRNRVKVDLKGLVRSSKLRERVSVLDQFKTDFDDMIVSLVGREGRLVIFVDDLDRCQPDRIVQVLDAIKLFLDTPRCVYLVGLDRDIVEQAIKVKFKEYRQPEIEAREYLEKIIGLPFDLPPLSGDQMSLLVKSLASDLPDAGRSTEVFALGQEPNPRKVKRTINMFLLLWALAQGREELKDAIKPTRLAKIVVIQHSYRDLYLLLIASPGGLGELEVNFRQAGADHSSELPEYLKPFAANSNLRRLLTLHSSDQNDANFTALREGKHWPVSEEEIRSYIRLTRAITRDQPVGTSERSFVGRQKEVNMFLNFLSDEDHARVLLISGQAGMGKSALMERYRRLCTERGITVGRIDLSPAFFETEEELVARIALAINAKEVGFEPSASRFSHYLDRLNSTQKTVILFDNYEQLREALHHWFTKDFLQTVILGRFENLKIVIAGRSVPVLSQYGTLVEEIVLQGLSSADVLELLKQFGVRSADTIAAEVERLASGNPVLISTLAEQLKDQAWEKRLEGKELTF
jgi:predicted ATPase